MASASAAHAFAVQVSSASYVDGVFRVTFEGVLDAPPAGVEAVLLDFARYRTIDPRIRRSQLLAREADGSARVRTVIDACAGIFCRSVERVERVAHGAGHVLATVIPEDSDMRSGTAVTCWVPDGGGTQVFYEAEFRPDFWVPGFIGQGPATRALRESTLQLFRNVEREANDR